MKDNHSSTAQGETPCVVLVINNKQFKTSPNRTERRQNMKKTILINGETFTVKKAITGNETTRNYIQYNNIYAAYERPSNTKVEIWEYWYKTLLEADAHRIGVSSKSSHMFTISFMIEIESVTYLGYITKTRQELTPLVITE